MSKLKTVNSIEQFELPLSDGPTTESEYVIYTDGSCLKNPNGPGGWCAIVTQSGRKVAVLKGALPRTTNNRAELTAALEALRYVPEGGKCTIVTDSRYVECGAMKWYRNWQRRGFRAVKNPSLWKEILQLKQKRECAFKWVRGHNGDALNEECDRIAKEQSEKSKEDENKTLVYKRD